MATTTSEFFTFTPSSIPRVNAIITTPINIPQTPSPSVICLHYWGGSAQTFYHLPPLLSSPCTTISLSHRGWGQSTGPSDANAYSISQLARDVLDLLPQLSPHLTAAGFVLVGHSMGAKVATAVAAQNPPGLRGMVLVGPAPPGPLALPPEMREQQSHAYDSEDSVRWTVENVLAEAHNLSEADVRLVVKDSLAGNQWARETWPRYGMAEDVSTGLEGRGLRVEVLVGRKDRVESVERVKTEVVDVLSKKSFKVDLTIEEDCGHLMPLEKPEAVAHAVQKLIAGL